MVSIRLNTPDQQPLVYEQASEKLVEFFPELRGAYRREIEWWGSETPGPHVIYEDLFRPHIEHLLTAGADEALRHVFDFIELLSTAEDPRLQDLVAVAIFERLSSDSAPLSRARPHMGPATRRILTDVQRR